ncbi:MAG: 4-hydroxy-tetrahydrodipicolinate synthase [Candidatus Caenarcaniphilales bacterium]|nr:4-hydroxy-tetrahydrodipicolinate synthase [Candidatus Caenarcaniphilales bacterium]
MINFGSLITAMVTPFKEDDVSRIDYIAAEKIIDHLVKTGTDSIIIAGTTGERPTLEHIEEEEFLAHVLKYVKDKGYDTKIIFGAGSNSTKTSISSVKRAEELGADGVLLVCPYYNKPNQKGMINHFSDIARNTKLPIILYNVKSRSGVSLSADSVVELAINNKNIVALKEASSDLDLITSIRTELDNNAFKIYSGEDTLTLAMMSIGADGVISVSSHVLGAKMKEMIEAYLSGNNELARQIHVQIFPVMKEIFADTNPIGVKAALGGLGICSARLRSPMLALPLDKQINLKKMIEAVLETENELVS